MAPINAPVPAPIPAPMAVSLVLVLWISGELAQPPNAKTVAIEITDNCFRMTSPVLWEFLWGIIV
jgi:hypothetical protein